LQNIGQTLGNADLYAGIYSRKTAKLLFTLGDGLNGWNFGVLLRTYECGKQEYKQKLHFNYYCEPE